MLSFCGVVVFINKSVRVEHVGKKKLEIDEGKKVSLERLIAGKRVKIEDFRKKPSYTPPFSFSDAEKSWPVGSKGFLDFQHDEEDNTLYVSSIAAKEGEGIGSRLMHEVEEIAKKRGCKKITYFVNSRKNKRAIYMVKKKGYELGPKMNRFKKKLDGPVEYRKEI